MICQTWQNLQQAKPCLIAFQDDFIGSVFLSFLSQEQSVITCLVCQWESSHVAVKLPESRNEATTKKKKAKLSQTNN